MNTLVVEVDVPYAQDVHETDDSLTIDLSDGCTILSDFSLKYEIAFAMLVHRSRYPEFNRALLVLLMENNILLIRGIIYTETAIVRQVFRIEEVMLFLATVMTRKRDYGCRNRK